MYVFLSTLRVHIHRVWVISNFVIEHNASTNFYPGCFGNITASIVIKSARGLSGLTPGLYNFPFDQPAQSVIHMVLPLPVQFLLF